MIHVVDTHALIWYLEDFEELGAEARVILSAATARLIVPTIVLAEARFLIARKRTTVSWEEIVDAVEADARFAVSP